MQFLPGTFLLNILMTSHPLISLKNKSIFGIHDPVGLRFLFQLRVSLSPLRSDKSSDTFVDTSSEICQCNQGVEAKSHFLFSCPFYVIHRAPLVGSAINILQRNNLCSV